MKIKSLIQSFNFVNKIFILITFNILLTLTSFSQISNTFKIIKIGNKTWMASNLNVDRFRNGDPIPQAKTSQDWKRAYENEQPAWCYYENNISNGSKYGRLYNWFAIADSRGLAPKGWHIANETEWDNLVKFLGGKSIAGNKIKSKTNWLVNSGSNTSGFSALPGGYRNFSGYFMNIEEYSKWWTSTDYGDYDAWNFNVSYNDSYIGKAKSTKAEGCSVRCVKD